MSDSHPNLLFSRYSDHQVGDLWTGSVLNTDAGLSDNDQPLSDFFRLVEWLESIPTKFIEKQDYDVSWVFADADGPFWFRMFWQSEVHDSSLDRWDDEADWDEDVYDQYCAEVEVENTEEEEDLTYAGILGLRPSMIGERATMWSQDGRRATSANTFRKKRHYR